MSWQEELLSDYSIDGNCIASFELLLQTLLEKSDRNLTAVTTREKIVDFHFRDSLSLLSFSELVGALKVADVGSGAGFPGLPLAICRPDIEFTLIEANQQKCAFLKEYVSEARLPNVSVLQLRAETAGAGVYRDSFDVALARAVGPLPVTMEYAAPLVTPGGSILLQRGKTLPGDVDSAKSAAAHLALQLKQIAAINPFPGARNLSVWVFKKVAPTPKKFPRRPGVAKKRPLC